ncbi:hypothetical protein [Devosia beringensis]|nr:hypothetical protein [Devosia beringensis]
MVANLGLALVVISSPFVLFIAALAYGAWMTRDSKLTGSTAAQ